MTKRVVVLLVSIALFFAVAASATTVTVGCGSASVTAPAQPGPPNPPFTSGIVAVTLTCPAFTIPAGQTLSDVQVTFKNDWQLGATGTDTFVFTYTITGFNIPSMASTVTGTGVGGSVVPVGTNQGTCSVTGDIVTCDDPLAVPIVAPGTFPAIVITVNAVWTLGGLDFNGSAGTTLNANYTFAPTPPPAVCPPYLIRYASNLNIGDSVIDISNGGGNPPGNANICANVYAFSPDEQMISCCSCTVTPDALVSLSVIQDLISNTLTPARPNSIVVKIAASAGVPCNAAGIPAANVATGLVAWGTTLHALITGDNSDGPTRYPLTETPFTQTCLSPPELARLTSFCGFIQSNGSGFGICRSCRLGGQGGVGQ